MLEKKAVQIVIIKYQIIIINVFLDLILFLYSHINSSKNENSIINNNTPNQICFGNGIFSISEKLITERLKKSGIENKLPDKYENIK